MSDRQDSPRLYKARGPDGEVTWVDHEGLWQLQQSQTERLRRDRRRRRRIVLLALAGLVALVLVLAVVRLRSPTAAGSRMGEAPPAAVAGGSGTGSGTGTGAGAGASDTEQAGRPEPGRHESAADEARAEAGVGEAGVEETGVKAVADRPPASVGDGSVEVPASSPGQRVADAVAAWAAAWARRDVPAYLASYSSEFAPADGTARARWEGLRRQRLLEPEWIRVEIERLEVSLPSDGRAEVRFVQRYRSPGYSDDVVKVLELVEEEGDWRIAGERVTAP